MNDLLDLYAKPHDLEEPVVCLDEKSKQLIADIRPSLPVAPGQGQRVDCHYKRHGTQNIFVAVEPKAGRRTTRVTQRRQRQDYAQFLTEVLAQYPDATKVHIIHDNLNIHAPEKLPAFFLPSNPSSPSKSSVSSHARACQLVKSGGARNRSHG